MDLEGSARSPLAQARPIGRVGESTSIDLTLLLRRRKVSGSSVPDGVAAGATSEPGPFLSREEFAARHGADPDDVASVGDFSRDEGVDFAVQSIGGRTVRLRGSAGTLGRLFGVRLDRWAHPGGTYRGRTGSIEVPSAIRAFLEGVFGFDDRPQARAHFRPHPNAAAGDLSYLPSVVAGAYDFPPGTDGAGQTIGLLELGGGYRASDLTTFFGRAGTGVPEVVAVPVDGASNAPTGDPNGPDGEVDLDIEVAGSIAPGARLAVYFAPNTDRGFLDGLTAAIHDTTHRPAIVSISWGGPESSWTGQALSALNAACEDAAKMGITVLVAAGDQGAGDGTPGGAPAVDFPASSPFATGCGGTRLSLSAGRIVSEVVWDDETIGEGATGGGVSSVFARPTFQASTRVPLSPLGSSGRGVPDIAGNADPTTGYIVRVDGTDTVIGGTSAVAPLWAALVARMNQATGRSLGYLNPLLYRPGASPGFRDITSGTNGGYSAGPGWDPCTGLGTPRGSELLKLLRGP